MDSPNKHTYKDGSISPGWSILDKPIPIGIANPQGRELDTEPLGKEQDEQESMCCSAMYVASQPHESGDVMEQIANEFHQATKGRKSSQSTRTHKNTDNTHADVVDSGAAIEPSTHVMPEEETEVWTCDEEKSELVDDRMPVEHPKPRSSTMLESTETSLKEDSTTLHSNDSSNADININKAGPSRLAERSNVSKDTPVKTKRINDDKTIKSAITGQGHKSDVSAVKHTQVKAEAGPSVNAGQACTTAAVASPRTIAFGTTVDRLPPNNASPVSRANEGSQSNGGTRDDRRPPPHDSRLNFSLSGSQSARRSHTEGAVTDTNGMQHKALLEIMGLGLGNFTNDVATIVIDKLRPEYDVLAKRVGQAVKEETTVELTELREKVNAAEKVLNLLEHEKNKLHEELVKEKGQMRKEIDKEKLQRLKENEEKDATIDQLEKELKKVQMLSREKDRLARRAESKAKTEEHKRVRVEETCDAKVKDLQKEISKLKSEILVQKSKNRVQSANVRDIVKSGSLARKLKSYHEHSKGKWPPVHPKGVPYDEGDP